MDMPKIDDPCVGCDNYVYEEGHEKFTGAGIDYRHDYDVDFDEDDYDFIINNLNSLKKPAKKPKKR